MYKLIIADDEKFIRDGLANLIDWSSLGFEIAEIFSEGEEVIEYLDSMPVDVVLTDIMMPHISGIDIASYIKEKELACKVVFITGHKDFEFALQAIKCGVTEYILKPSKVDEIRRVFSRIKNELDAKYRDIEYQEKIRMQWEEMHPLMAEKFVGNLIMGAFNNKRDMEQRLNVLYPDVDISNCACVLADMEIKAYDAFVQNRWHYSSEQFDEAVYNFIGMFSGDGHFHIIYKYKGKIKLFIIMKQYGASKEENESLCKNLIEKFIQEFGEIFRTTISIDIIRVFRNVYHVMESQEDMIHMISTRDDGIQMHLLEQKKMILTNIMTGNIGSAQKIMKNVLNSLTDNDMHYRIHVVIDIFSGVVDLLREENRKLYQLIEPFVDYHTISNMTSVTGLSCYCDRIFQKMKTKEGMNGQHDNYIIVNQIKTYVNEHIYEDVTLETVANKIFISTTHLSRVFKKQTGETFLQYVTRKKMEKAMEMLADSETMVYQIGEQLGYKTSRYFSKLFQSYSGYYPSQYRKEVLKMREVADEEEQI